MSIQPLFSNVLPTPAEATATSATSEEYSQEFNQFLELLTTQVQNQDPFQPLDSTQFVEQLATFSGLEQQVRANTLLESILTTLRTDA